tara:strand:- start:44 stop:436 length:393 start_codon:yes stop_codon:yes gene_type:complete
MGETKVLADFFRLGIERERGRARLVVNRKRFNVYLDFACGQAFVRGFGVSFPYLATRFDDTLRLQLLKKVGQFLVFRIEDELGFTFTVAQVDEEYASVITYRIHPSYEGSLFSGIRLAEFVAVMSAFHVG